MKHQSIHLVRTASGQAHWLRFIAHVLIWAAPISSRESLNKGGSPGVTHSPAV